MAINFDKIAGLTADGKLPPNSESLNLGCGPEPNFVDLDLLPRVILDMLYVSKDNVPLATELIAQARTVGAWFYWRYAGVITRRELRAELGDPEADKLISNDDRSGYNQAREVRVRRVLKERFGIELEQLK